MAWNCLSILNDKNVWQAVANYLVWFERKSKFKQDVVVMEWYRYTHQGTEKANFFQLPFDGSSTSTNLSFQKLLQSHKLCQSGMQLVMGIGDTRMQRIQQASQVGFILPQHKGKGKVAHNAFRRNDNQIASVLSQRRGVITHSNKDILIIKRLIKVSLTLGLYNMA